MPADDGIGVEDDERVPPPRPAAEDASPQEAIDVPDAWTTTAHHQLVTKREVLQ